MFPFCGYHCNKQYFYVQYTRPNSVFETDFKYICYIYKIMIPWYALNYTFTRSCVIDVGFISLLYRRGRACGTRAILHEPHSLLNLRQKLDLLVLLNSAHDILSHLVAINNRESQEIRLVKM